MRYINLGLKKLVKIKGNVVALKAAGSHREGQKRLKQRQSVEASTDARPLHAVIIVENMTVPPDRRVWQQARALRDEGWRVSVITPKIGSFTKPHEILEGIAIYRHPLPIQARHIGAYALEYVTALFFESLHLARLDLGKIDVVQICNPPDFLFAPALLAKTFGNAKVVFDHHDLTPELLIEKTGSQSGALLRFARWAEQQTFKTADRVISTNCAFRDHAITKGKRPEDVNVVYSAPDLDQLKPGVQNPALKAGKEILLFWVGVIGSQDGIDLLLDAIVALRQLPGGDRFRLLIAGDGPDRAAMEAHSQKLGLSDVVEFAGFLSGDELASAFATADIGVGSDPKNQFNDRLAMNKVMEYMAYSLPIAMFDLAECRKIAEDAAFYVPGNSPEGLAARISNLIEAPGLRERMGQCGRARLEESFSWERQKQRYLDVYRSLIGKD